MYTENCKNCENPRTGKYCSYCGQKAYTEKDKSIPHLFDEALHFITHFEGKFFITLKTIYRNPGKLSLDYSNGIRQKYYKPLSFYLLSIILYLLFPLFTGMNMEMKNYRETPFIGQFISEQIEKKATKYQMQEDNLSVVYKEKSKTTSKFLLLLLIPLSLPILFLLYPNKKLYLFDKFILLTEINIFFLLTFFLLIPFVLFPFIYFLKLDFNDHFLIPISMTIFSIYCVIIFQKYFNQPKWLTLIKGLSFVLLFMAMLVLVYRTIVFEVTFALI
jgi:hypothetical protein